MSRFSSLLCSLLFCMITYAQEITVILEDFYNHFISKQF